MTVVIKEVPERKVAVTVVAGIEGPGASVGTPGVGVLAGAVEEAPNGGAFDIEEMTGVTSGVLVTIVLNRLGGAMLFIHSVVPLTTEK